MSITVHPTHSDFVAEISAVDLARPLAAADRDAIEDAINGRDVASGQTANR